MYIIDYKNVKLPESILKTKQKSSLTYCFTTKEEINKPTEAPKNQIITLICGFEYKIQIQKD